MHFPSAFHYNSIYYYYSGSLYSVTVFLVIQAIIMSIVNNREFEYGGGIGVLANMTLLVVINWIFRESSQIFCLTSSIPYRICFSKHGCPKHYCMDTVSKTVLPGQNIAVTAVTVGKHSGANRFHLDIYNFRGGGRCENLPQLLRRVAYNSYVCCNIKWYYLGGGN